MRESLNSNTVILLCLLLSIVPISAFPGNTGVSVKTAETSLLNDNYMLSAEIGFHLSPRAEQALRSGVPLIWTYHIKVQELRDYLWDQTIEEKNFSYRMQFHALLNMYRIKNENNGIVDNFTTLQAALDSLSTLRDFPLIDKAKIADSNTYVAKLKITFERDALPLPLRPVAYLNPQWYLSSDWYICPLKK